MKRRTWIRGLLIAACAIVIADQAAYAQQGAAAVGSSAPSAATAANSAAPAAAATATAAPASDSPSPAQAASSSAPPAQAPTEKQGSSENLQEVVINGIRRGDLIMPTTVTSNSVYGLDLDVMDVPRNTSVVSQAQLAALNIQNPGGFSYLTSSSYSDASFGQPNVPRIRGQYADVFFNGMRDSFTLNGYGAPMSFNSTDSIDIVKGPASVQAGPGAGVGGEIDITTKMPSFSRSFADFSLEADTYQKRIASFEFGTPISSNTAARVSITSNDSGSYYYDMYFHQQAVYAAFITKVSPDYTIFYSVDYVDTRYRENDGINRVDQNLIDTGEYLTGGPPLGAISGYLTTVDLPGTTTELNPRTIIDEPQGTSAHSEHIKGQVIQTVTMSDNLTITNNTFYDFLNRYNQIMAYYADTAKDSYSIENKTDVQTKFSFGSINDFVDGGFTYRFSHVWDVQNYINEPVSVYDLSNNNPESWVFPSSLQPCCYPYGAFLYPAAFGHSQWGSPGRNPAFLNDSVDQDLQDIAVFIENRLVLSPQWSVLTGLRGDLVQLNYSDPLGGLGLYNGLPQSASTAWYGLRNGNISVVYSPIPEVSAYVTYNNAQYVLPTANDGAVATWGEDPSSQLQQDTTLEEAGLKFDLFNKALFISTAGFHQTRAIPIGVGLTNTVAHINGAEAELNFQPNPSFFATASYSYLSTVLNSPGTLIPAFYFYNFPAEPGTNIDGAGNFAVYQPNQNLQDPGVPQHLFNVLANYKHPSGFGAQANIQVTGPFDTTQSGYLNIAATNATAAGYGFGPLVGPGGTVPLSVVNANGYYTSPRIPWQYTVNTAVFYNFLDHYMVKLSVYNLTNEKNLVNDIPYYGNDFLTRTEPRSFDLTFTGKF